MRADEKLEPFATAARRRRACRDGDLVAIITVLRKVLLTEAAQALELAAIDKEIRQRTVQRWQLIQNQIDDASSTAMAVRYASQNGNPKVSINIVELADRSVAERSLEPLSDEWKRVLRGLLDEMFEAAVSEVVFARNGMMPYARKGAQSRRSMLKAFDAIVDAARPDQSESAGEDDAFTEGLNSKSAQVGADDDD